MSCPICCEDKSTKKLITCSNCNKSVCHECVVCFVKTLTGEVRCMLCKHPWDRNFLIRSLPKTIVFNKLREQREQMLIGQEKAKLPDTSRIITLKKLETKMQEELAILNVKIKDLKTKIADNLQEQYRIERDIDYDDNAANTASTSNKIQKDKTKIVVCPCPVGKCKGFIFSDYKCTICEIKICKKCYIPIDDENEHVCKDDDVASVELIKKECKTCPKCGASSRKTEGCSQVWCMVCKTAWNWNTQKIEIGAIHATDYYDYVRRNGGVLPPVRNQCQQVNPINHIQRLKKTAPLLFTKEFEDLLIAQWRKINEWRYNVRVDPKSNLDLRIKFLNNEIDENRWKQLLHKRDKDYTFKNELYIMKQAYNISIRDQITTLCESNTVENIDQSIKSIYNIYNLFKNEYNNLASCFKSKMKCPFDYIAVEK